MIFRLVVHHRDGSETYRLVDVDPDHLLAMRGRDPDGSPTPPTPQAHSEFFRWATAAFGDDTVDVYCTRDWERRIVERTSLV